MTPLRTVALLKQVPRGEHGELGENKRLERAGRATEMNPWCRRALAHAIAIAGETGGRSAALTMGPSGASDVAREALACGIDQAWHLSDPALAGADCLITARALAAALARLGPLDLVVVGRSSVDGSTGAVGAMVAETLGWPFVGPAKEVKVVDVDGRTELRAVLQADGALETVRVQLPAVVAVAERSCAPAKAREDTWPDRTDVRALTVRDLTDGVGREWGSASPTEVISVALASRTRRPVLLDGDTASNVASALDLLTARTESAVPARETVGAPGAVVPGGPTIVVVTAPDDAAADCLLLGEAASLALRVAGRVIVVTGVDRDPRALASWGADEHVVVDAAEPAQAADAVARWVADDSMPWAILGGACSWSQELLARLAVRLDAGLMSDLIAARIATPAKGRPRLIGTKPSGDGMVAEIAGRGATQIATLRTGGLAERLARERARVLPRSTLPVAAVQRVWRLSRSIEDDHYDALERARTVIGVGRGVDPTDYPKLVALRALLGAELAATRKVTDAGWLPHSRQVGITARSIAPDLYIALGMSGNSNHLAGVARAGTVLAVNIDPQAAIFTRCDIGIVADWRTIVPRLAEALSRRRTPSSRSSEWAQTAG